MSIKPTSHSQYQLAFRKTTGLRVSEQCPRCGDELVHRDAFLDCASGPLCFCESRDRRLARLMTRILELERLSELYPQAPIFEELR